MLRNLLLDHYMSITLIKVFLKDVNAVFRTKVRITEYNLDERMCPRVRKFFWRLEIGSVDMNWNVSGKILLSDPRYRSTKHSVLFLLVLMSHVYSICTYITFRIPRQLNNNYEYRVAGFKEVRLDFPRYWALDLHLNHVTWLSNAIIIIIR